jgi:hypothetical protein
LKPYAWILSGILLSCCGNSKSELPPPGGVDVSESICLAAALATGSGEANDARRDFRATAAAAAKVKYLRWEFPWERIEPDPGQFDFSGYDRAVDRALEEDIEYIGLLSYGNPWASSQTETDDKFPPDDPADFANYVRATVAHFAGRVGKWEIWNEQNAGYRFWKPSADPAAYADLLKAAYVAVKQADPAAEVAFGGTFFAPQGITGAVDFIREAFDAHPDLGDFFDAMAFHPYMLYPPSVAPESKEARPPFEYLEQRTVPEMIADIREVMEDHGVGDKPIWITEMGWPVFETVPADLQAAYLERSYLLSLKADVPMICWYTLQDSTGHTAVWEDSFGLFTYDDDPLADPPPQAKPAYAVLVDLATILSGTRFDADLTAASDLPPDAILLRFANEDRSRQVLTLWSTGEPGEVTLELDGKVETVTATGDVTYLSTD